MVRIANRLVLLLILVLTVLSGSALAAERLVIVQVTAGADVKAIADAYDGKVLDALGGNNYLLRIKLLSPKVPVSGLISMESNSLVRNGNGKGGVVGIKPGISPNWYINQPAFQLIHADKVRRLSTGKGLIIADINALVDYSHPALKGHLTGGYDFVIGNPSNPNAGNSLNQSTASFLDQSTASFLDQSTASFLDQSTASFLDQSTASFLDQSTASFLDTSNPAHGHGTMVAGIIAAIAPEAMIMPIRAFDDHGYADQFVIAKAIRWAVDHGADVINMSFGADDKSKLVKDAIDYADKNGVTLIASAGNENTNDPQYPAAFPKVTSIAATDLWDMKARFSNYGDSVAVSAPGVSIITAYPGGYYAVVSGTSFAAPIVAAEAALLRDITRKENIEGLIKKGTVDIDNRNPGYKLGDGRVDLTLALQKK
jgi:subtilisin family serine protease